MLAHALVLEYSGSYQCCTPKRLVENQRKSETTGCLLNMHLHNNALIYIHLYAEREGEVHEFMYIYVCITVFCSPLWTDSPPAGLNSRRLPLQHLMSVQASSRKPCCSRPMGNLCPKNTHTPISTFENHLHLKCFYYYRPCEE